MTNHHSDVLEFLGSTNPIWILKNWLKEAQKIPRWKEPLAMCLSTVNAQKKPSSRIVLLKALTQNHLVFFTNYLSPKGLDLKQHPFGSVVFFWAPLQKQIRISGTIKKTSRKQSITYWKKRDKLSQLSQYISQQSQPIHSRQVLKELQKEATQKFKNKPIPCPQHWGGYQLRIQEIEFWIGKKHRLHDRFLFQKNSKGWGCQRLFP